MRFFGSSNVNEVIALDKIKENDIYSTIIDICIKLSSYSATPALSLGQYSPFITLTVPSLLAFTVYYLLRTILLNLLTTYPNSNLLKVLCLLFPSTGKIHKDQQSHIDERHNQEVDGRRWSKRHSILLTPGLKRRPKSR